MPRKKIIPTHKWRTRINKQCWKFKVEYFKQHAINEERSIVYSPDEGRLVHFSRATVDHVIPLCQIVDQFLELNGLDRTAKPQYFKEEWRQFHKENAVLRIVSTEFNQRIGNQTRRNKRTCGGCPHKINDKCEFVIWGHNKSITTIAMKTPACRLWFPRG